MGWRDKVSPVNTPGVLSSIGRGLDQGATARFGDEAAGTGAQAADWMQSLFGGEAEQIPKERAGGASAYSGMRDSERHDNAAAQNAHPYYYGGSELAGGLAPATAVSAATGGLGMLPITKGATDAAVLGALFREGGGEAPPGENHALDASALQDDATLGGAMGVGGRLISDASGAVRGGAEVAKDTLRGRGIAGPAGRALGKKLDNAPAGLDTYRGIGHTADEQGIRAWTSKGHMQAADARKPAANARIEGAVDAAQPFDPGMLEGVQQSLNLPPEPLQLTPQGTMLPPSSPNAEAQAVALRPGRDTPTELRQGVPFGDRASIDMRPKGENGAPPDHGVMLPDAEYVAAKGPTTMRPARPGQVPKAQIADEMQRLIEESRTSDPTAKGRAYRAEIAQQLADLEALPDTLSGAQALKLRRAYDANVNFDRNASGEGAQGAHQDVGRNVRQSLRSSMDQTSQGPEFAAANKDYQTLATLSKLAEGNAYKGKDLGHLMHRGAAAGAGHAVAGTPGMLAAPMLEEAASHFGWEAGARGFEGLQKTAGGVENTAPHLGVTGGLPPGSNESSLDIWAVGEKQKNATDPEYRRRQRESAQQKE